jgi:hypothetical protein
VSFPAAAFLREIPGIRILLPEENRITNTNVTYTWDVPQTRAVREIPGEMSRKASCGKSQMRCPAKAMRDTTPGMSRSLPES